ncbi:MAG: MBL fold metallo-hydrolase [Anaerolineae bacterium]|nr:MBL fold metallo-hydrolase [Anaerolineae bacterium]
MSKSGMSRREWLRGAGLAALGGGLLQVSPHVAYAQISATEASNNVYYRFKLGDADFIVVSDTAFQLDATIFGSNQDADDVIGFFENLNVLTPQNSVNTAVLNLVMLAGDTIAVFDTGTGNRLARTINDLGIGTENVTDVLISHYHGDHVGGLTTDGALTYPNAMVHFPQPEYNFMQTAAENVVGSAMNQIQPALDSDQITFYEDGAEIIAGVQALYTPGHTPGHMSFLVSSGDAQLLHVVDAVLNAYATLPNPTWHARFDTDPGLAVETRQALLARAADDKLQVMGYHFPFPGLGYVAHQGDGYQWVPVAF